MALIAVVVLPLLGRLSVLSAAGPKGGLARHGRLPVRRIRSGAFDFGPM